MTSNKLIFSGFAMAVLLLTMNRIFLVHVVFNNWLRRQFRKQVVIIGTNNEADAITQHIIKHNAPFWVVGTVGPHLPPGMSDKLKKGYLGGIEELPDIASKYEIDDIIITNDNIDKPTLVSILDFCISAKINAWFSPKSLPIINIKLHPDFFCGLPLILLCSQKNTWLFDRINTIMDAFISLLLLILLLPVFLFIILAIKLDSKGPIFYRAQAIGKNGHVFSMFKFRSMKVNSDDGIHKSYVSKLIKGEIGKDENNTTPLKITDDPRVTRVGKILRKFSLDELPQLINVLKGDMSLVGPRPCLPYEFEMYQDWCKKRTAVQGGITGLWQITGRSEVSFDDMVLLDLYYIYNRSISLNFNILFETIFVVLRKKGAY
jgi:undecaprenyl-phosphate galactose phosphotransferase